MEHKEHDSVLAFDTLFTNNHIRKLKIIMPLFPTSMQGYFAVYIKYLELMYTFSYFDKYKLPVFSGSADSHTILNDLLSYSTPEEKEKISQIKNLFSTMETYQNMMEMMSMMKEMFPEGEQGLSPDMLSGLFGNNGFNMSDIFQMFQDTDPTNN